MVNNLCKVASGMKRDKAMRRGVSDGAEIQSMHAKNM